MYLFGSLFLILNASTNPASRCLPKNGILLIAEATKSIKENSRNLGSIRDVIKENGFELHPEGCYDEYKFTFIEARKL